ncbi:MAG: cyclic nucleotide-binding domain-containing protein [Candidatus Stahlbacteria bacterium]|nr:cyclic nucleotide-binding domain-containing protein [candidate division WOR-3 bacterium]MCK4673470.1 cyclic nucleotide-binding domain-containing protein [candidate division WOR-3 bacterium]MCK4755573.1 cyclic nucleotide-binding domain-containing protein [candidate division WOR-3 bacterium]TET59131.1 MAG: cyclic nucleotide-binding domain-containing protein [Candidatus Stahlbacteria bacterium]
MKDKDVLSQVYLFRELTPSEMDILISISKEKRAKKDEVIFKEGATGDAFYLIVSGSVRISTIVPGVGEEALTILREGEYFGEMALIDDAPRSASAIANDDTILLLIKKDNFRKLLTQETGIAYKLLWVFTKTLSARLRKTDEQLKSIFAIAKTF